MSLSSRDRRALSYLALSGILSGIYWFATSGPPVSAGASAPVPSAQRLEKRLSLVRQQAASVPAREAVLKGVNLELATREKGLIKGDTAAQAQAQLLQILREVAKSQQPPLDIRQVELGQPRTFGENYGEVTVSVTVDCRVDQLVNFLSALSVQPEVIATDEVRFGQSDQKHKNMPVRLTVSGIVPRRLVPVKKGVTQF